MGINEILRKTDTTSKVGRDSKVHWKKLYYLLFYSCIKKTSQSTKLVYLNVAKIHLLQPLTFNKTLLVISKNPLFLSVYKR